MNPRISMITLGVKNIESAKEFYQQGLGWPLSSMSNTNFAVFQLQGIVLCLYLETLLAEDSLSSYSPPKYRGVSLAYNVGSKAEVREALQQAVTAGAKLLKPAQEVFWGGYSGYFADPDGHLWEVAWNPYWPLSPEGQIQLPV